MPPGLLLWMKLGFPMVLWRRSWFEVALLKVAAMAIEAAPFTESHTRFLSPHNQEYYIDHY